MKNCLSLAFSAKLNLLLTLMICLLYRSPNSSEYENSNLNNLIKLVAKKFQNSGDKLLIVGDFNYPDICWESETCQNQNGTSNMFLNTVHQCYLTQFIDKPTHSRVFQNPTLIDLIL